MNPQDIAIEELRQLQSVINRMEQLEFQVRAWLLALLGAMVAARLTNPNRLTGMQFLILGVMLSFVFLLMELVVRIPKRKAIKRVWRVEGALRGDCVYDGPRISISLSAGWQNRAVFSLMFQELRILPVYGFYIPVVAILVIVSLL